MSYWTMESHLTLPPACQRFPYRFPYCWELNFTHIYCVTEASVSVLTSAPKLLPWELQPSWRDSARFPSPQRRCCCCCCFIARSCPTLQPCGEKPPKVPPSLPVVFSRKEHWSRRPCPPPASLGDFLEIPFSHLWNPLLSSIYKGHKGNQELIIKKPISIMTLKY